MSWTEERVDLLKKLWAEGVSASLIADHIGDITRNAVIGKVHRLGLESRKPEIARIPKPPPKPPMRSNLHCRNPRDNPACSFGGDPDADILAPDNERHEMRKYNGRRPPRPSKKRELAVISKPDSVFLCTIMELTEKTCRWPIGDPGTVDFRYCGAPGADNLSGRPYCRYHERMAYAGAASEPEKARAA